MKKILFSMLCLLFILILSSCNVQKERAITGFFSWMDSYIALAEDEPFTIALTFLFESDQVPFEKEDLWHLEFQGLENHIQITDFSIEESLELSVGTYSVYTIIVDLEPIEKGVFYTDYISLYLDNQPKAMEYPIGQWIFDIGELEPEQEYVDTWQSPAASSNREEFVYSYYIINSQAKITKIYVGDNTYISDENGLPESGGFPIPASRNAPVHFIKSKLELEIDGEQKTMYGKGCYCGAIDMDEDLFEISRKFTEESRKSGRK